MDLHLGDIVLVTVEFHQGRGAKVRPAIVILDSGDEDFVAAPVTSRPRAGEFELVLVHWQSAGLNVPSVARVHKIAVLAKASVFRVIGSIAAQDLQSLRGLLCRAYCPASG